jgi:hypothetical protein
MDTLSLLDLCKRLYYKENKSDREEMRKEFKLLIEKGLKTRIKEIEDREDTKNPLAAELPKDGKQFGELEARHLPCPGMINKLINERLIPDFSKLPNVNLKH